MKSEEYEIQCMVIEWAELESRHRNCQGLKKLFSTLNGIKLTIGQAVKAKKAGNRKGVTDLILPCVRGGYCGLWIELKTATGSVSPEQKEEIEYLNAEGYHAVVCRGFTETISVLKDYVTGRIKKTKQKRGSYDITRST
jgi:hypothetical protein